jgi:hypothetical protein
MSRGKDGKMFSAAYAAPFLAASTILSMFYSAALLYAESAIDKINKF